MAALGRLFVFVVDQGTLEPGNVRHVARAASRFFSNLTFVDRSALMLLPAGPNVNFTWAHDRVQNALTKVIGQSPNDSTWEFGSLTEARDIANRSLLALRTVGQRECGRAISDPFGGRLEALRSPRRRPRVPSLRVARRAAAHRVAVGHPEAGRAGTQGGGGGGGGGGGAVWPHARPAGWEATAARAICRCGRSGRGAAR